MEARSDRLKYLDSLISKIQVKEYGNDILFSLFLDGKSVAEIYAIDVSGSFNTKSKVYLLESLDVDEEFRGRGFASALLLRFNKFLKAQRAIAYLRNGAYSEMELWDIKTRKPISIKSVYERYGYEYLGSSDYMANFLYVDRDDRDIFIYDTNAVLGIPIKDVL